MEDAAEANARVAREYLHDLPTAALIELGHAYRFARANRGLAEVAFRVVLDKEPRWESCVTRKGVE